DNPTSRVSHRGVAASDERGTNGRNENERHREVAPRRATVRGRGLHHWRVKAMSTTTATAPARQRKPCPKPARSIRLCLTPFEGTPGVVRITVGNQPTDYFLTELPADFGRGFRVEKVGTDDRYAVNLDGERHCCDCKGFARWQRCKHADGLAALLTAGRL